MPNDNGDTQRLSMCIVKAGNNAYTFVGAGYYLGTLGRAGPRSLDGALLVLGRSAFGRHALCNITVTQPKSPDPRDAVCMGHILHKAQRFRYVSQVVTRPQLRHQGSML